MGVAVAVFVGGDVVGVVVDVVGVADDVAVADDVVLQSWMFLVLRFQSVDDIGVST